MKNLLSIESEKIKRKIINKLNNLKSNEWLLFQKSWFIYDESKLFEKFITFFTKRKKRDGLNSLVISAFSNQEQIKDTCKKLGRDYVDISKLNIERFADYCLIDLRNESLEFNKLDTFFRDPIFDKIAKCLDKDKYLTIFINNEFKYGIMYPLAWDLARNLSKIFSLKDEKISCINSLSNESGRLFLQKENLFYCLNFRKSEEPQPLLNIPYISPKKEDLKTVSPKDFNNSWLIPKPPPREKDVLLHPAKFPETLIKEFIEEFTEEGDIVLDPMVGTGSTLVACLETNRNGIGIELNERYASIAKKRIDRIQSPKQKTFLDLDKKNMAKCHVQHGDARKIKEYKSIPPIDYCITSPPYWDMLRMKGASTQKLRKTKGLDVIYSEDLKDLGNISDYEQFLLSLLEIYFKIYDKLKNGAFLTVIVKNVKKGGIIYPLAWDLTNLVSKKYVVYSEQIWCQNDINLAPYGYGNAWVSNTFHHYCLNFRKVE